MAAWQAEPWYPTKCRPRAKRPGMNKGRGVVATAQIFAKSAPRRPACAKLIARTDELEAWRRASATTSTSLSGWRFDEFGPRRSTGRGRIRFRHRERQVDASRIDCDRRKQGLENSMAVPCLASRPVQRACPRDSSRRPWPGAGPTCRGEIPQSFIGQPASRDLAARMMAATGARTVRWVAHGMAVTMEYSAQRLTVYLDASGRVERAACG